MLNCQSWKKFTTLKAVQDAFNQKYSAAAVENDRFNALVLSALFGHAVKLTMLRALTKYLDLQLQVPFSVQYMQQTLRKNAGIPVSTGLQLFEQRFWP